MFTNFRRPNLCEPGTKGEGADLRLVLPQIDALEERLFVARELGEWADVARHPLADGRIDEGCEAIDFVRFEKIGHYHESVSLEYPNGFEGGRGVTLRIGVAH
jgi:hypothetical protein